MNARTGTKQGTLFDLSEIPRTVSASVREAVKLLADSPADERGAVFTKPTVVQFMLDLTGYLPEMELSSLRLLEPSFGEGDFLFPIIDRLIECIPPKSRTSTKTIASLVNCIRAVELHSTTFGKVKRKLKKRLTDAGFKPDDATELLECWLINDDFLLTEFDQEFDFVVGNPPYLRQEKIPESLVSEYRKRFVTLYDRADLYIPFIEHALMQLSQAGRLCFICADRWMKNRYGGPLRALVASNFHLNTYVDMSSVEAFKSDVTAYPAITVISKDKSGGTQIVAPTSVESDVLQNLIVDLASHAKKNDSGVQMIHSVKNGAEPWIFESQEQVELIRKLESLYPTLEEAGCKVGIGVATGADKIFIAPLSELDVEDSRKLPLAMTRDISDGLVKWRGFGVINPFEVDGRLVNLSEYPRLKNYLLHHKEDIASRHVAKKSKDSWYRTIDRIYPALATTPKLLIPDIKGEANVVFERGELYPHHNLYYITSSEWDLHALQAILRSGMASAFVSCYSTKMRGGYLRFQAQYLRKIRVPHWEDVPKNIRQHLIRASTDQSVAECDAAVCELFKITRAQLSSLQQLAKAGLRNGN